MRRLAAVLIILLFALPVFAGSHKHLEKEYQHKWCSCRGGVEEVVLKDGTRADCAFGPFIIEFDFIKIKKYEAIGQSLHYKHLSGKRPGIVYILEDAADVKYLKDILPTCEENGITVWTMSPEDLE